jgi:alkylated DNA repair dioxygenase AlkB
MQHVIDTAGAVERIRLPLECEAEYFPGFLSLEESRELFSFLSSSYDLSDIMRVGSDGIERRGNGKFIFADPELTDHRHLHEVLGPRAPWPPALLVVKERLEALLEQQFHVCLCIRYRSGEAGAAFHVDMPEFGSVSLLTVISLGAEREFVFRTMTEQPEEVSLILREGSLLTMGEGCQDRYQHGLPLDPGCRHPRISLSYRMFGWPEP